MDKSRPMAFVTKPGQIEFQDVPIPALGARDVHIRVKAVTICGSDLHIFRGAHPSVTLPVPVGHEIAGEVVAIGTDVESVEAGDRVTVEPVIICEACEFCQRGDYHLCANISFQYRAGQGGITPDFVAMERWVHKLPETLSYLEGALIEPLSVAVHAARRAGISPGDNVAIFGAGPIGLLVLVAVKSIGAGQVFITDVRESRLQAALGMGADVVINSGEEDPVARILEEADGLGVPIGFEVAGLEITFVQLLESLKKGGRGVLVGIFEETQIAIPANRIVQNEIALFGSQGYHWDFQRSIKMLEGGSLDLAQMITHQFNLEETQEAFEILEDPAGKVIKAVITP